MTLLALPAETVASWVSKAVAVASLVIASDDAAVEGIVAESFPSADSTDASRSEGAASGFANLSHL